MNVRIQKLIIFVYQMGILSEGVNQISSIHVPLFPQGWGGGWRVCGVGWVSDDGLCKEWWGGWDGGG